MTTTYTLARVVCLLSISSSLFCSAQFLIDRFMFLHRFSEEQASHHGARCLDGTPSGYYYRRGQDTTSWIIELDTWFKACSSNETCGDHINAFGGMYGSSKGWFPIVTGNGLVSASDCDNKDFYKWNHVIITGCSGDLFSGQHRTKVNGLYFAGHLTIAAVISDLMNKTNFRRATRLVVTGVGVGGIAVFEHADYFTDTVHWADVKAVAVGGFFFPRKVTKYSDWLKNKTETPQNRSAYNFYNSYVNTNCKSANPDRPYLCGPVNIGFLYPYIKTPIYIVQSQYDCEMTATYLEISESHEGKDDVIRYLEHYGGLMRDGLKEVKTMQKKGDALFSLCVFDNYEYLKQLFDCGSGRKSRPPFGYYLSNWYFGQFSGNNYFLQECKSVPDRPSTC